MAEDLAEGHTPEPEEGPGDLTSVPEGPGWQADPFDRERYRWWDGAVWTAYVTSGTDVRWDPAPIEEVRPREPGLPGVWLAVVAFGVGVGLTVAVQAAHAAADRPGGRAAELALSSVGLWSVLLGAVLFVSRRRGTGSLVADYAFRFRWSDIGIGFAGSLVGRVVSGIAVSPVPMPSRSLDEIDEPVFEDATNGPVEWIVLIVIVCVGAPLIEELFFRGLLQTRLAGRFGAVWGISVASLLFGAAHLIAWSGPFTLAYAWAVAGGGLVLGVMRHYTGRLGPPIVAHAFFNAEALLAIAVLG
jgi:membrane protease YdiL (CAAX protease family)